jgi:hypothetical protein
MKLTINILQVYDHGEDVGVSGHETFHNFPRNQEEKAH